MKSFSKEVFPEEFEGVMFKESILKEIKGSHFFRARPKIESRTLALSLIVWRSSSSLSHFQDTSRINGRPN